MKHFHRTHVIPTEVLKLAETFFPALQLAASGSGARTRTFSGPLGTVRISARPEGGHYTFVEAETDQMGESRLDRNVKRFFVQVHRKADPAHTLDAAY